MTGRLRDYFVYMCTFILLIIGYTMYRYEAFAINTTNISPIDPYMWLLTIALVIAIVAVPFINIRMMVIFVTVVYGFLVVLFFFIFHVLVFSLHKLIFAHVSVLL